MKVYVYFRGHLYPAEPRSYSRASVGDEPLQSEQLGKLFYVGVEAYEIRSGKECLSARLVREAIERPLSVIYRKPVNARQPDRRRVEGEDRDAATVGLANRPVKID